MTIKKIQTSDVQEIIKHCDLLWEKKDLCEKKGMLEQIEKKPTKEHFATILLHTKQKITYAYELSLEEYKTFKVQKFLMWGLK